tara:strand:- start:6648 stop:7127 length:480 start_codon:yes stop_codon:yes gene_type:complete
MGGVKEMEIMLDESIGKKDDAVTVVRNENKEKNKMLSDEFGLDASLHYYKLEDGMWIVTWAGILKIANCLDIDFQYPEITFIEGGVYMCGHATMKMKDDLGEEKTIWSTGEATTDNCAFSYRLNMAEKRLKTRLTLMLADLYHDTKGEDEADDFKREGK